MMKRAAGVTAAPTTDPPTVSGTAAPLDAGVSSDMGTFFKADFSNVRVHTGDAVDGALGAAGARAMTRGTNIYFRNGEYEPGSKQGRELIGHELAHVVQQSDGRSSGPDAKGEAGSTGGPLEGEADQKGAAAATAPFDWEQVDLQAFELELRRREASGEPVPVGKTMAEARALPLAREIAAKCLKDAKKIPANPAGPAQHKKEWNLDPVFGGGVQPGRDLGSRG